MISTLGLHWVNDLPGELDRNESRFEERDAEERADLRLVWSGRCAATDPEMSETGWVLPWCDAGRGYFV